MAEYLIQQQNFRRLEVKTSAPPQFASDPRLHFSDTTNNTSGGEPSLVFENFGSLIDFATRRWQERWVTTSIGDASTVDRFLQRPFFLLVSVDAPVSLRWQRFADR